MVLTVTGHRPSKLGGYSDVAFDRLIRVSEQWLTYLAPARVITGMAQGFDQAVAQACLNLSIPFSAYIPCPSQSDIWPPTARVRWARLCAAASSTVIVCPTYTAACMDLRNRRMVDDCTDVLACWDGTSGGTANCVRYARSLSRPIHNCHPEWLALSRK